MAFRRRRREWEIEILKNRKSRHLLEEMSNEALHNAVQELETHQELDCGENIDASYLGEYYENESISLTPGQRTDGPCAKATRVVIDDVQGFYEKTQKWLKQFEHAANNSETQANPRQKPSQQEEQEEHPSPKEEQANEISDNLTRREVSNFCKSKMTRIITRINSDKKRGCRSPPEDFQNKSNEAATSRF